MSPLSFRFGTVGSPKSTPKKPGGSVGAVMHLAELGLLGFELGWVRSVRVSPETCAQIQQTAQENDVAISVHAPYFFNLNANDEEWPKSRQRLMDAAHYGNLAGATDIIFHPGSYFERPPEEVLPVAIPRLQSCLEELRSAGNPVTLRPEMMGKSAMLGRKGWFTQGKISIIIGPLNNDQLERFSPDTSTLSAMNELVQLYLGTEHDYEFKIRIKKSTIPAKVALSGANQPRIGWNTWLSSKPQYSYSTEETVDISISSGRLQSPKRH
jgi:hypothetical protein